MGWGQGGGGRDGTNGSRGGSNGHRRGSDGNMRGNNGNRRGSDGIAGGSNGSRSSNGSRGDLVLRITMVSLFVFLLLMRVPVRCLLSLWWGSRLQEAGAAGDSSGRGEGRATKY